MNFLDLSTKRCSVRDFTDAHVEREKLEYILNTARIAPSAVNYQPWFFIVIREEASKQKLHACYNRDWFKKASVYIMACGNHDQSWKRKDGKNFCNIDVAIAIEHICLAATEIGLGSCWVCNFDLEKCKELFELPEHIEPIAFIPIGYPADNLIFENTTKKRKSLPEIVRWEKCQ